MPNRFTDTGKWDRPWFRGLTPAGKLLLQFIRDKCDIAGFWEVDLEAAKFHTGIGIDIRTLESLQDAYVAADKGFIWLKDFIINQGNWPLKPNALAHRGVARCLLKHNSFIETAIKSLNEKTSESLTIDFVKSTGIGISKSKGIGKSKYDAPFEYFWKQFKGRWDGDKGKYVKVGKFEAWREWQKLTLEQQRKAAAAADKVTGKYTPDACRWLKRKMFDDFNVIPEPPAEVKAKYE